MKAGQRRSPGEGCVGWAKARTCAVPTIYRQRHPAWWARFQLRSLSERGQVALPTLRRLRITSITDPQPHAAMNGIADRLRAGGAVDEEVGDPALCDAEAEAAAIFEPALIADRRHHDAVAGHGGDDAGARCEGLHPAAIDVGLDA